jgi:hypothetical protein
MTNVAALAFIQGVAFSVASRSRNTDSLRYHFAASLVSHFVWFACMREVIVAGMGFGDAVAYACGASAGSVAGQRASMAVEQWAS